jgi:hypothetical protein
VQSIVYYVPLCLGTLIVSTLNLTFLNMALVDITRRNYQMQLLSSSLKVNFQEKDAVTLRLPTLNFIDPKTMTAWLEARKLVLDIGSRFIQRIQFYLATYLAIAVIGTLFIIIDLTRFIELNLSTEVWICVVTLIGVLDVYLLTILYPYSYVNEQTKYQIERLVFFKGVL